MEPFLKEVAQDLVDKFGENLQDCAIVFNNKRPATYLQKYLAEAYQKPVWSPVFYTVHEFFATASNYKIADAYMQLFTLYDCYLELLMEEGLEKLPSIAKFHPVAKIILGDFNQIDNDLVDANQLFVELEDIALINQQFDFLSLEQKEFLAQFWQSYSEGKYKRQQELFIKMWHRMPRLYQLFHKRLGQKGFVTMASLYRQVANGELMPDFTEKYTGGKLIFIGFNALSKAEAKAFKRWQGEGKALFYFDTDAYYLDDNMQEAGLFLRRNIQQGLVNQLNNDRRFIGLNKHRVNVYKVQGQAAQAKIVNDLLKLEKDQLLKGSSMSSTAIVLADESLLIPLLQTIPSKIEDTDKKLELNITMGFALKDSPLYGLASLWLTSQLEIAQNEHISYANVQSFLSHPLTLVSQHKRNQVSKALVDEQLISIPATRLVRQGGLFEKFFIKAQSAATLIGQFIAVLEFVMQRLIAAAVLKKIEAELFEQTLKELTRLNDLLNSHVAKYQKEIDLKFVLSLIQKALSGVSVALTGDPLEGIQVMGLLESRNLNFDRVIMLGLNEGIVPQASTGATFIPDSLRRAYGLPVLENQDAISAYMFYRLLQRSNHIDFVYNALTDERNSGEPSRFIKQLQYESGFEFCETELYLPLQNAIKPAIVVEKTPKVQWVLNQYLKGERTLSASALITYIANPVDFFYKYIAGIEEPKEVEETVEARRLGSILHYVMEHFYRDLMHKDPEISANRIEERKAAIPELILLGFADQIYGDKKKETEAERLEKVKQIASNLKLTAMQKIVREIIKAYITIILAADIAKTPFRLVGLEQNHVVDFKFDLKGISHSIKLKGIIDRVDFSQGVYQIIDYKTGSDQLKYATVTDSFNGDGTKINKALVQTLMYTYVYETATQHLDVEPNLYVVRSMANEDVRFTGKSGKLIGETLASEKNIFLVELEKKLAELFDFSIPFKTSAAPSNYAYSIYKDLFGKS